MVVFGAGSAGVGIADQVRDAIATEMKIDHEEASQHIWQVGFHTPRDSLLTESLG
jgi:malate dehydrogenase (oxaloacetate-decarboxylating)